jgi:ParB-like chromosome segregation protein Spo0J
MRWGPRRKRSSQRADQACQLGRETQYNWIRVKKILLPKSDAQLDEKTVAGIAESIQVFGQLHPIAVRRVTERQEDGETTEKIVLVAGAHRLEAVKRLGRKKIPCSYVEGDETDAQLVQLGENLWRKTLTVLRHAEGLAEYIKLASAKLNISGQLVEKSKPGRPPGGIALAARELPLVGRSAQARRKIIDRAIKINRITPEAKKAAIEARLDNNQRALLKIAKAGGQKAQLRMVADLAEISKKLNAPLNRAAKRSTTEDEASKEKAVQSPPLQPAATQSATNADDTTGEETGTCRPSQKTTTFDEMVALWKSECRASWAYMPSRDRERFIEMLRRARRRAPADVVEFLKDVFWGREKVSKQDLFGFAATHGFATSTMRKALKQLGYRTKRKGRGWGAKSFIINPDLDWKEQVPVFSSAKLKAAGDAQPDPRDTAAAKDGSKTKRADYFEDI